MENQCFNSMSDCALAKGNGDQKNLDSYYKNNFNDFMALEKSNYLIGRPSSTIHIFIRLLSYCRLLSIFSGFS